MPINPNTDFTAGAVLTAAQQNRFPRGVMGYNQAVTTSSLTSSETATLTTLTFTAVANRYYKITYFEPLLNTDLASEKVEMRVRLTNIAGAVQGTATYQSSAAANIGNAQTLSIVKTFTAGSVSLITTLQGSGNFDAVRNSTNIAYFMVEDIGPA